MLSADQLCINKDEGAWRRAHCQTFPSQQVIYFYIERVSSGEDKGGQSSMMYYILSIVNISCFHQDKGAGWRLYPTTRAQRCFIPSIYLCNNTYFFLCIHTALLLDQSKKGFIINPLYFVQNLLDGNKQDPQVQMKSCVSPLVSYNLLQRTCTYF